jgi:hypothetical protein
MAGLPDNYFGRLSPAGIISAVSTITLAAISTWSIDELKRVGWLNNPIVDILYSMTSAGVWIARTDASGYQQVADTATKTNLVAFGYQGANPMVGACSTSSTVAAVMQHKIAQIPLTEAGGSIAATAIVTGIASYKARCIIRKIWAPTGTTDAANTWSITSEAGGAIIGPSDFTMNLTALRNHWVDAGAAGVSGTGILCYNTTADKDILLSAADLAAVGTTYNVEVEYWYEA